MHLLLLLTHSLICLLGVQSKAVVKFIDAIAEKTLRITVTMTAARGRGKSAALGLAIAGAVAMGSVTRPLTTPLCKKKQM